MPRPASELRWPDLVWSHFSRPPLGGFDDRVGAAADTGFAGIGLYLREYERLRDQEGRRPADLRRLLDDHGLVLAEIETLHGWSGPTGEVTPEGRRREDLAWEIADVFGARYLQVIGPYEGTIADAARAFAGLCDRAAAHGLLAGIEWLPFTNLRTVADARAVVETAGRANGGYCVDIWHHRRGGDTDGALAALGGERVFAVQMNDGPATPTLDDYRADCLACRVPPGEGSFDCVGFVRLLAGMGVTAPISLEVCSTELWEAPAVEAARRSADAMRAVLAEAGAGTRAGTRADE